MAVRPLRAVARRQLRCIALLSAALVLVAPRGSMGSAPNTVCVKIQLEIAQKLSFEADGFLATLRLANSQAVSPISELHVAVEIRSDDGADASALFFVTVSSLDGATAVDGTGDVAPETTAEVTWLIVPTIGAGGELPSGKNYTVRAVIHYRLGEEDFALQTFDEVITVQPQPLLRLEYMLPTTVPGDDPFTAVVEPPEPYPLAVRVSNEGFGTAKSLKVESAQPKIVANLTGAAVSFEILGTYVDSAPVPKSMAIEFGTIAPASCSTGAWEMLTSLQGTFTSFDVKVSHKESLGGAKTSKIAEATTNFLVQMVQLDSPGKDSKLDFLVDFSGSADGLPDAIFESDCLDTPVDVRPGLVGPLESGPLGPSAVATTQPSVGWNYFEVPDPTNGSKALTAVQRLSDGKLLHPRNAWRVPRVDGTTPRRLAVLDFAHIGGIDVGYRLYFGGELADVSAPVTSLVPVGPTRGTTPLIAPPSTLFVLQAADDGAVAATFFRKDGGPEQQGGLAFFETGGHHTLEFYSLDVAGNAEVPQVVEILTDNQGPSIVVTSPTTGGTYDAAMPIFVQASVTDLDPAPQATATLVSEPGGPPVPISLGAALDFAPIGTGSFSIHLDAVDWFGQHHGVVVGPFSVVHGGAFSLTGLSPNAAEPGSLRELVVSGTGFAEPMVVELEGGEVEEVSIVSEGLLEVRVVAPATPAAYDIVVRRGQLTVTLADALEVSEQECASPCVACGADVECLDGNACTQDVCDGGTCVHDALADCCPPPGGCSPCLSSTDANGTGTTNIADVMCLILLTLWDLEGQAGPPPGCVSGPIGLVNLNCDGQFTIADVQLGISKALGLALPAQLDLNSNQCVDACDTNTCGDAFCAGDETCVTCAADCGACPESCCTAHGGPGCHEPDVQSCVCTALASCCTTGEGWSVACAQWAATACDASCGGDAP